TSKPSISICLTVIPNFSDRWVPKINNTGKGKFADSGRFEITKDSADLGKFKVPGLRNVAVTAPYMHNAMFKTLDEVIEFYDQPDKFITGSINRDTLVRPLNLTPQEKSDLKAFLEALTDQSFLK
ncbi:MAG: cytochrome-c peroxidase, partial [Bacteroidota bacterium]